MRCTGPNYLRQCQRKHGQVHTAASDHRCAKHSRYQQSGSATSGQRHRQRGTPETVRQGCTVSTECKKSRVTETDQTAQRHHGLQADAKNHQDQRVSRQRLPVGTAKPGSSNQRHKHRKHQQRRHQAGLQAVEFLRRFTRRIHGCGCHTKQALWPEHQHHCHGQKHQHQRRLWKHADTKGMHQADQQCRHKGPADTAKPAHHDDHKGLDDHVHVHLQVRWLARQLQRATKTCQRTPQHHSAQHQWLGVDAQRSQHAAVVRGSAQTAPKQ